VRIRQSATRAAWNGARASIGSVERAGAGGLADVALTADDLAAASAAALELMTPGDFPTGEHAVVLDGHATAVLLDAVARALLTARGRDDGELGAALTSPLLTVIDDPGVAGAYGGFAFDDEGEPAAPITLLDRGRVVARLADHASGGAGRGRRPGHLALVEPAPSHLQLAPGTVEPRALYGDGFLLERGVEVACDPARDRLRLACARARELKAGNPTGRVYADVELVGSLRGVLAAVDGVANAPASFAPPTAGDPPHRPAFEGEPLWRSIAAPAVRTRGLVRARRSRA
jgi:predicted Zn-dependent protease